LTSLTRPVINIADKCHHYKARYRRNDIIHYTQLYATSVGSWLWCVLCTSTLWMFEHDTPLCYQQSNTVPWTRRPVRDYVYYPQ